MFQGRARGRGVNNQQNQNVGRAAPDEGDFPSLQSLNLGPRGSHSAPMQQSAPQQPGQQQPARQSAPPTPAPQQRAPQQHAPQQHAPQQHAPQQQAPQQQSPRQQAPQQQAPQQQAPQQQAPQQASNRKSKFPPKKGVGTKGIKMTVETNHLAIQVRDKNMVIMHYDVDMKLVCPKDESLKECPKKYLM